MGNRLLRKELKRLEKLYKNKQALEYSYFLDALITFWVFINGSDVLTQIEESELCHLTDWIE